MSLLTNLIQPVSNILDKVIPDQDLKRKIAADISTLAQRNAHDIAMAQIEVLKADAKGNWFQSSWRPLAGYIAVLGMGVNFLISPIAAGFGIIIPQADMSMMMPLLMGMLGIGAMRSYDKKQGTDTKNTKI